MDKRTNRQRNGDIKMNMTNLKKAKMDYNRICNKIVLAQAYNLESEIINTPELENEIYKKIDAIIDNYNFLPCYTMLLEELYRFFTFDEIYCNVYQIQSYYRYMKKFDL